MYSEQRPSGRPEPPSMSFEWLEAGLSTNTGERGYTLTRITLNDNTVEVSCIRKLG